MLFEIRIYVIQKSIAIARDRIYFTLTQIYGDPYARIVFNIL